MKNIPEIPRKDFTIARHILLILSLLRDYGGNSKLWLHRKFTTRYHIVNKSIEKAVETGLITQTLVGRTKWYTITKTGIEVLEQWKNIEAQLGIQRDMIR